MEPDDMTAAFEAARPHLQAVAYRMLGSAGDAEDAVQEAWLRLTRADRSDVENVKGWLTTVVARVCLDVLRARRNRREASLDTPASRPVHDRTAADPERETVLADAVGLAVLVVLDRLSPAERLAFVLHDMFALPFDEIAAIAGRSPAAVRQLASRGRRRVRGAPAAREALRAERDTVDRFLTALRARDFSGLVAVLDPDVHVRVDAAAAVPGRAREIHGADAWARGAVAFAALGRFAAPALINGRIGIVFAPRGRLTRVMHMALRNGRIADVEIVGDPAHLAQLEVQGI